MVVKDWRLRIWCTTLLAVFELQGDAKKCYRKFRESNLQNKFVFVSIFFQLNFTFRCGLTTKLGLLLYPI